MTPDDIVLSEWSVYGNRLLFLDALSSSVPGDKDLFAFARVVLKDTGADSLIVLKGSGVRNSVAGNVDAEARILEVDGSESLSCGNGLLCAAALLRLHGRDLPARIMTGAVSKEPCLVEIGIREGGRPWLRHCLARRVPDSLYVRAARRAEDGSCMDLVRDLGAGSDGDVPAGIVGRLVLTGEPHLVVFADQNPVVRKNGDREPVDWLPALGRHLNIRRRDMFPEGVNVDLVLGGGPEEGIRYRCFERGVNNETGACGTGAMAVASVWREVRGRGVEALRVLPRDVPVDGRGYMLRFGRDFLQLSGRPLLQSERVFPNPERISLYSSVS